MSTIIATTLSNGSVSVPTATVVNGSAKAWVNFDGTGTIAIRDSFNVASLTDLGTGIYTITLSSSMLNGNYTVASGGGVNLVYTNATGRTVSSFGVVSGYPNSLAGAVLVTDGTDMMPSTHGDLA